MSIFPVSTSTLSAEALGVFVQQKYVLDTATSCTLLKTGINHTYLVVDEKAKYVLRVYYHAWRSREEIQEELALLLMLKEKGVAVSVPISSNDSVFIQTLQAPEGERYAVLFSFAEGEKVRFMNGEICTDIGSYMATMHQATKDRSIKREQYTFETLLTLPYQHATAVFSEEQEEMKYLRQLIGEIQRLFVDKEARLPKAIVHLDLWYDNMSVSKEKGITFFDFDFCGTGWMLLDVAYFAMQLFHVEVGTGNYELKLKSFLDAYGEIRPLTADERELIPHAGAAIWIFYLGVQCQRFDWTNLFLSENYLKMYISKLKAWLAFHEK